ncbi:fimbrial protein [Pseudomonas sp. RIT-PI-S]|uniref:fimbrial protein n=1 Tax=Pseudomonas sp. RIT-PI-S TaxID=3035295 RepID=UPI0021D97C88|nr:fimbrial protein [Pseudomonas sp. RIT-PI-S]
MKHRIAALSLLAVGLAATPSSYAAPNVLEPNGCYWVPDHPGPAQVVLNVPDMHIAQDAPVGTEVAVVSDWGVTNPPAVFECQNNSSGGPIIPTDYNADNAAPIAQLASGLPRVALSVPEDSIIETNIPGLGVSVLMTVAIDGRDPTMPEFVLQKAEARVPFRSTRGYNNTILRVSGHLYFLTLVKTGPIPAGLHSLDPGHQVVLGRITQSVVGGVDTALNFSLSGNLTSSGCSTAADPVTPNPVHLGDFEAKDFERAGSASPLVPFQLNLVDCNVPPPGSTLPRVHLQLDPANGSAAIDATQGLFSTGAGSSGGGVAFQVLRQDGIQAMPLSTKEPITTLPSNDTNLPLNVRLVKHTGPVTPGTLTGALNFLLTYE